MKHAHFSILILSLQKQLFYQLNTAVTTFPYYYSGQFRRYIAQFLRVFSGIQVKDGVDRDGDGNLDTRTVPVHYGSMDRIAANVIKNNGTFINEKVPLIAGYMTGISLSPNNRRAPTHIETIGYQSKTDGSYHTSQRRMPVPYQCSMDLYLYASSSNQMFELLEQILILFNPSLAIQRSSDELDWTYITEVTLTGIQNQENFPMGTNRRVINQTLTFTFDAWLNFPAKDSSGIIEQIITNVKDDTFVPDGLQIEEFITDQNS